MGGRGSRDSPCSIVNVWSRVYQGARIEFVVRMRFVVAVVMADQRGRNPELHVIIQPGIVG